MVVENLSLVTINATAPYVVEIANANDTLSFINWFGIYGEREEYVFLPQTIYDEEGNDNYVALIIRKDNPHFADLVSEFMSTVNLLNAKPGKEMQDEDY